MVFLASFCPVFVWAEGGPYKFYVCEDGSLVGSSPAADRALKDVQEFLGEKLTMVSQDKEGSEIDLEKMEKPCKKVKTEEEKPLNSKEIQKILEEAGLEYALELPEEEQTELVAFLTSDRNTEVKETEEQLSEVFVTVPDDSISFLPVSEKIEPVLKNAGLKADISALKESEQKAQRMLHLLEQETFHWKDVASVLFSTKEVPVLWVVAVDGVLKTPKALIALGQKCFSYLPEVIVEEFLGVFGFVKPSEELIKKYSDLQEDPAKTRVQFAQALVNFLQSNPADRAKEPSKDDYSLEEFEALFKSLKGSYGTNSQLRSAILEIEEAITGKNGLKEWDKKVVGKRNWKDFF
ncbi:MAG: hypothetical protein BGO07_02705 [Alphaproteobacteria bacterium 40-19]|nr:MAG: hypothetical protein BGO07_02705 [Alphaproteobacteria bacterium 40-19]